MNANQYLHRYGATRELLGHDRASTAAPTPAATRTAIYRDPMTMDDYFAARPITTPFGLYDCDVPCDASIAVIVSDASVAGDLPQPAIRIEAVGTQILERVSWDQGTITHEPQVLGQSAHLWTRTSLRPADVDLALLYDGFTFNAVSWLEALGFCGLGEAQDWLDGGRRIALDGELPVNPHGGQLSEGRTHGFGFLYEAIVQLRREAGERQVADARHRGGHLGRRHAVGRAPAPAGRRLRLGRERRCHAVRRTTASRSGRGTTTGTTRRSSVVVDVKPGARFRSAVCEAEVVVVKAPAGELDLRFGGHPVVPVGDEAPAASTAAAGFDGACLIGKRYVDELGRRSRCCAPRPGTSSLSLGDELLVLKDAKPLPSSD